MSNEERMHILQMIEDGTISAADGLRLLDALTKGPASASSANPEAKAAPPQTGRVLSAPPPNMAKWQRWWLIPLSLGVIITVLGALFMYWVFTLAGVSLWLVCASVPFALGVAVVAFAASTRTAKWVHVRVKTAKDDDGPRNIAISLPIPLRFTAWVIRTFGHNIPQLQKTAIDEVLLALSQTHTADNPLYVEVNEGEGGEQVQVYIG